MYLYTMDLVKLFACVSKWANPHFVWVNPLVNFKMSLFLVNTRKFSLITEQIKMPVN